MKILVFVRATTFGLTTMVYGFLVKGIVRTIRSKYRNQDDDETLVNFIKQNTQSKGERKYKEKGPQVQARNEKKHQKGMIKGQLAQCQNMAFTTTKIQLYVKSMTRVDYMIA